MEVLGMEKLREVGLITGDRGTFEGIIPVVTKEQVFRSSVKKEG